VNGLVYVADLLSLIVKRSKYFGVGAVKQKRKMEKMYYITLRPNSQLLEAGIIPLTSIPILFTCSCRHTVPLKYLTPSIHIGSFISIQFSVLSPLHFGSLVC